MAGDVELLGLYWTVSGPVEVHVGREWSLSTGPTAAPRRARSGSAGSGSGTPISSTCSRRGACASMKQVFDDNGLTPPRARVPDGLVPRPGRRAPPGLRRDPRAALRAPRPSSTPTTSRSATSRARRPSSRSSPSASASSAPTPPSAPTRRSSTSSCRSTRTCSSIDAALEVVGGAGAANGGIAIDTWHMSKLGIAPDELRRIPLEYLSLGRAERRPVRRHGRPRRRDGQPPQAARRGRVRPARLRRGLPGPRLRRALGRRGALRGAAQQPDRRHLPAGLRDDRRPIRTERSST